MPPSALIVEDDTELCEIFAELFEYRGMQVECALDGQQALDILAHLIPDVILLDMHLPRVSGLDVLKWVQADARFVNSRIIVVTADILLARHLDGQIDHVLTKPVEIDHLLSLLN